MAFVEVIQQTNRGSHSRPQDKVARGQDHYHANTRVLSLEFLILGFHLGMLHRFRDTHWAHGLQSASEET